MTEPTIVYAVFAQLHGGIGHDWLAVYTSYDLAQRFVDAQDAQLRQCLVVWPVTLDAHPTDDYWVQPQTQGLEGAFHALAGLPEDMVEAVREARDREKAAIAAGNVVSDTESRKHGLPTIDEMKLNGRIRELESRVEDAERVLQSIDHPEVTAYFERDRRGLPEGTDGIQDLREEIEHQRNHIARLEREDALLQGGIISNEDVVAGGTRPAAEVIALLRKSSEDGERGLGTRLAAILRDSPLPDDAIAAIEAMRNGERDVAALQNQIAELERSRAAHMDWLRETVTKESPEGTVELIRRMLGIRADVADRIERHRPHLERLASGADDALVCGTCGRTISQLAGYPGRILANTHFPGTCGVCGHVGSVSPSADWIG